MSLRARLTIFYTTVLGAVLVLFGLSVYGLISTILLRQIDSSLQRAASDLIFVARVEEGGSFIFSQRVSLDSSVIAQVWDNDGVLVGITQSVDRDSPFNDPLDPEGLAIADPIYRNLTLAETPYRVLSVPLYSGGEMIGVLQAGTSLTIIEALRGELVEFLLVLSAIAILIAGFIGWANARRALKPLSTLTNAALQITRADDLSKRIPLTTSPDDEVGQLIVTFNDTIARLEELFATQRRFVADVGHELRTPLTVIRGNVDLMRKVGVEDEESLHSIELEIQHLTRLVEDLLLLAQAETGKLPMNLDRIELDTLLLEVFNQARVLAGEGHAMSIGDIDQVIVCGDRDRLKQVLMNLVANAIKYSEESGEISVGLSKQEGRARLEVHDSGSGIPTEELPFIFERFYRGDKARHRLEEGAGFGLGLSIAYWIVRNHGGEIEAQSEKGEGSTFTVTLPLAGDDCLPPLKEEQPDAAQPEHTG
jgi:signal transduction histidine kinase